MPGATWLRLSLATRNSGQSRGAALSQAAIIAGGGRDVHQGALRKRAFAFSTWREPGADAHGLRFAAAPLAELVAAHRSTGIPDIVAGIPLAPVAAAAMRIGGPLIGRLLSRLAGRASTGSERASLESEVSALRSRVWAEARDAAGTYAAAMLETGEGYHAAAAVAVRAVEQHLHRHRPGAFTPAQAFGPDFVSLVPGTRIAEL
jgi:short subunit dehydrogenase-like uncharacterized protein